MDGWTADICNLGDLRKKFETFGWNALEVDGHDVSAISDAIEQAKLCTDKPSIIVLNTIKGKDCCFAEEVFYNHFIRFDQEEYERAINYLDDKIAVLRREG